MKVGCVPVTPQKEGAWLEVCRDGRLLAATLLLALLSSGFTVMSLYRLAALQADLMSLRTELQGYRASAIPAAAPEASGASVGTKVSSPLLCLCGSPRCAAPRLLSSNRVVSLFLAPSIGSSWTPQLQPRSQEQTCLPGTGGNRYGWGTAARAVLCTPAAAVVGEALCVAL